MKTRVAVMGFRHGHIWDVHQHAGKREDTEIVACCEEDRATREQIVASGRARITHASFRSLLDSAQADVLAVGDCYGRRGALLIEALKRGKHVISDKPICTSLEELDEIERLANERGLAVGCMLDLRDSGQIRRVREMLLGNDIGEVHAVSFNGQHPLMYGSRPGWYFEAGEHGGTINDIAIHAVDVLPWMTGRRWAGVSAARNWNARLKEVPHFLDAAQMMLTMDNGAGVLGDVSYLAPDTFGYSLPCYWEMMIWGAAGLITCSSARGILLYRNGETAPRTVEPLPGLPGGYFDSFLREIRGERDGLTLSSAEVLASSRATLRVQEAADKGLTNVKL